MSRFFSLFLLSLALLGGTSAFASEGDSLWSHTYGGTSNEAANCIIPSGDGGFLLAGKAYSSSFNWDMRVIKVNGQGDLLWWQSFGGTNIEEASSIIPSGDGGFLVAGRTASNSAGGVDMYLVKINAQGDLLWSHSYGGSYDDWASCIIPSGDGGFLLAGATSSYGAGSSDMWLVKVNTSGDLLWSRTYGGNVLDLANAIIPSGDGNFLLAGATQSYGVGDENMWLVKVDSLGNTIWAQTYGNAAMSWANSIIPSGDQGFLLTGAIWSLAGGAYDMYLVKVNASGVSLWAYQYGGASPDVANAIVPSGDGNFLLAGTTESFGIWDNMWLVKVSSQGSFIWSHAYGGNGNEYANSIISSGDGNFLMAGSTSSFGAGGPDMWLICVEGPASPIAVTLRPNLLPIQIPASGGSFNYTAAVVNNGSIAGSCDTWIMVLLPGNVWYGPVLGPLSLTLPAFTTLTRLRTQNVPGSAPTGLYFYEGRLGIYPDSIWNSDSFPFTKLGSGSLDLGAGDWANTGEEFEVGARHAVPVSGSGPAGGLCSATPTMEVSPNPFNPTTVASFELQAASFVNLSVYDIAGRLVTTLVNGWRETGEHRAMFDGSGLAAGIYLYRLTAGTLKASGKMVLLK